MDKEEFLESIKDPNKEEGLLKKYRVEKISNPGKSMDCIVLEFDDPIARAGIYEWANMMMVCGYTKCALEVFKKLAKIENEERIRKLKK